jgi:hypothetical protein
MLSLTRQTRDIIPRSLFPDVHALECITGSIIFTPDVKLPARSQGKSKSTDLQTR